jgi:hypothetical protein
MSRSLEGLAENGQVRPSYLFERAGTHQPGIKGAKRR